MQAIRNTFVTIATLVRADLQLCILIGLMGALSFACATRKSQSETQEVSGDFVRTAKIPISEFPGMLPNVISNYENLRNFKYPEAAAPRKSETGCADLGKFPMIMSEQQARKIQSLMKSSGIKKLFASKDSEFRPASLGSQHLTSELLESLIPVHEWAKAMIQLYNKNFGDEDPLYLLQTAVLLQPHSDYGSEELIWHKDWQSHVRFSLSFFQPGTEYLDYIPSFFQYIQNQTEVQNITQTPAGNSLFFASQARYAVGNGCWHRQPLFDSERLFFLVHAGSAKDYYVRKEVLDRLNNNNPSEDKENCQKQSGHLNLSNDNETGNSSSAKRCEEDESVPPKMLDTSGA